MSSKCATARLTASASREEKYLAGQQIQKKHGIAQEDAEEQVEDFEKTHS